MLLKIRYNPVFQSGYLPPFHTSLANIYWGTLRNALETRYIL